MLTYEDGEPTIRFAIYRRIDKEPGVTSSEVKVKKLKDCIRVGVWVEAGNMWFQGVFELPQQFELSHLHNEIDQIAEQLKAARRDHFGRTLRGQCLGPGLEAQLAGTGLRGLWKKHA